MPRGKNDLIDFVVTAEWQMVQDTQGINGRAACQNDIETFYIMRGSQFSVWDEKTLSSYARDLQNARLRRRNLLSEKYAWMMASTSPEEFEEIRELLPALSENKKKLAEEIGRIYLAWDEECAVKYPALCSNGRPVHSEDDRPGITSSETYLRGELYTYSERTLRFYLDHVKKAMEEGRNLCEETLNNEVREYGYDSAESYEKQWKGEI